MRKLEALTWYMFISSVGCTVTKSDGTSLYSLIKDYSVFQLISEKTSRIDTNFWLSGVQESILNNRSRTNTKTTTAHGGNLVDYLSLVFDCRMNNKPDGNKTKYFT
jgi:hypothetical protein